MTALPSALMARTMWLLHRAWSNRAVAWLRFQFRNWMLLPFMLRRTVAGRKLIQQGGRLRFYGHRLAFAQRERMSSARLGSTSAWQLTQLAFTPLVYAALAVTVLVGSPIAYHELAIARGWRPLPLSYLAADSYIALMGTVAQAAAAMLALFFTAISVVTSTTYAKVPTGIRSLIARDDLNRRYLRLLAHTAATSTAGLGLHALGAPASSLLGGYVILLAGISLLAFLPLGIRTFALFDPSNLTDSPARDFGRAVNMVTHRAARWLDPSFQHHANRIAQTQLQILDDLIVFGFTEGRSRQGALLEMATTINRLSRFYIVRKSSIPSDSLWFTRRAEFKRWEVSSSAMTGIALQTGVAPPPESIPDWGFYESRSTQMTAACLHHLFAHGAFDEVVSLLFEVNSTATVYSRQFEQDESLRLVRAVRAVVLEGLKATDKNVQPLKHLQIVDVLCVAALSPILTAGRALSNEPIDELIAAERPLLGLDRRGLYTSARPRKVLKEAEYLLDRLAFERSVEGSISTQPWYVREVIALAYAEVIRDAVQVIVATLDDEFVSPATDLVKAGRTVCAGGWLHRGIEACHKARDQIAALETRYIELKRLHVSDARWLPSGAEDALASVETARVRIVQLLAGVVPELCALPFGGTLPDLLGQTRAWLAQELVLMMERKNEIGFADLFLGYFNASLATHRQLVEFAKQPECQDYIRVAMDAILDVMDVSGLALLFSELDGTRFGELVACAWDFYFKQAADKPAVVRAFYAAIESKLALPVFSPSAMQRQEWGRRLAIAMSDRGIAMDRYGDPSWGRRSVKPHPSSVIESVAVTWGHPMDDPHEYFGALYLAGREEAHGIDAPHAVQSCMQAIKLAKQRQMEFNDEPTDESTEE